MDSTDVKNPGESTQASAPTSTKSFCQKRKSENGSFMSELKIYLQEFIHSSLDDHKTCLRTTFHKAYDKLKKLGDRNPNPNQD